MSRLLLLILGLCLCQPAGGQAYFNKRETLHSIDVQLWSVLESKGKYYCTGWGDDSAANRVSDTTYTLRSGIRFAVFDAQGNRLHDTIYMKPWRNMEHVSKSLVDDFDTSGHWHLLLISFDSLGHVRWDKEYDKPMCTGIVNDFWQLRDFKPDGHGNWLMLSTIKCNPTGNASFGKMLLTKLDSSFNVIWHKAYGDDRYNSIAGSLLIDSSAYLLAGFYTNNFFVQHLANYQAEIFKTDTAGNTQWHWYGDKKSRVNRLADIIRTRDGNYIYTGCIYCNGCDYGAFPWIEKIDTAGHSLWNTTVSSVLTSENRSCISSIKELPDGDLIAAGNMGSGFGPADTADYLFAALLRLRPDGTIKWARKYKTIQKDTFRYNFYDMKPTSDGGYVMCGEATDEINPLTLPTQRGWIVKVDSNGCASNNDPQCWPVGVAPGPKLPGGDVYKVYPNPASGQLHISFNKEHQATQVCSLMDMTGRTLCSVPLTGVSGTTFMDVSKLQPGIYLYRITEAGITKASGKIAKQ